MAETAARKSVPLSSDDLAVLADMCTPDTALRGAMTQLLHEIGCSEPLSESAALHALLLLGRRCVEQRAEQIGYATYAAGLDDEDGAVARVLRNGRRVARDSDEFPRNPPMW